MLKAENVQERLEKQRQELELPCYLKRIHTAQGLNPPFFKMNLK
jgi:hypothetical protein